MHEVKPYEIKSSFTVGLFIRFIESQKQRKFVYVVIKKKDSLRIKISFPKPHSAPLNKKAFVLMKKVINSMPQ